MEDNVREGLVSYLARSKKRSAAAISPPARQPLVVVHPSSQDKAIVMDYTMDGCEDIRGPPNGFPNGLQDNLSSEHERISGALRKSEFSLRLLR